MGLVSWGLDIRSIIIIIAILIECTSSSKAESEALVYGGGEQRQAGKEKKVSFETSFKRTNGR